MGTKFLLDSNTVIYLLSNSFPTTTSQKIQSIIVIRTVIFFL